MKAEQFNRLMAEKMETAAASLGFKRNNAHFYLHRSPNVLILFKSTMRSTFEIRDRQPRKFSEYLLMNLLVV